MKTRSSFTEKSATLTLLIVLIIAVFPLEGAGMLYHWYGTQPSIIFQAKFMKFSILELVLGLALLTSYLYYISLPPAKRIRYRNNFGLVNVMFLACIAWGYIGTFWQGKLLSLANLGISYWKVIIYGIILFVTLSFYIDSREKLQKAVFAIVLACLALDVFGLGRYLFFGGQKTQQIGTVVFWETSKLGLNVFVLVILLGTQLLGGQKIKGATRLLYRATIVLALATVFLSSRRTSMIMVMVALMIFLWFMAARGKVAKAVLISTVGAMAVLIVGIINFNALMTKFVDRIASVEGVFDPKVRASDASTQSHIEDLRKGWSTIQDNFVWGVGYSWEEDKGRIQFQGQDQGIFWVHNSFLTFWIRFGLVGAFTYLYIYFKIFRVLHKSYKRTKDILVAIFLTWFIAEFLSGLFFPPFFDYFKNVTLFFGPLALANAYLNIMRHEARETVPQGALQRTGPASILATKKTNRIPGAGMARGS